MCFEVFRVPVNESFGLPQLSHLEKNTLQNCSFMYCHYSVGACA